MIETSPYFNDVIRREIRYSTTDIRTGEHWIIFNENSDSDIEFISEHITINSIELDSSDSMPPLSAGFSNSSGEVTKLQTTVYDRVTYEISGTWEEWEFTVTEETLPVPQAQATSDQSQLDAVPIFCGWPIQYFTSIKLAGEEQLFRIRSKRYTAIHDLGGSDDHKYDKYEFWIDESGRLLQQKWDRFSPGGGHVLVTITYSGFGEQSIIVAPVNGTLHETFLEMGADGTAVGFTQTAGELESLGFTIEGAGATRIWELKWQDGKVWLTLETFDPLTGYVLDFFDVYGAASLSLDAASATVAGGKLTWAVAKAPWQAGDHLMLRMRERGSKPILRPSPTPTPTPTPTITSTLMPSPTPATARWTREPRSSG